MKLRNYLRIKSALYGDRQKQVASTQSEFMPEEPKIKEKYRYLVALDDTFTNSPNIASFSDGNAYLRNLRADDLERMTPRRLAERMSLNPEDKDYISEADAEHLIQNYYTAYNGDDYLPYQQEYKNPFKDSQTMVENNSLPAWPIDGVLGTTPRGKFDAAEKYIMQRNPENKVLRHVDHSNY